MRGKRVIIIVSVLFYLSMIVLTVSARRIHIAGLPRVIVGYLEMERFAVLKTNEQGGEEEGMSFNLGIPKELYDNRKLYVIEKTMVNGEERNLAREVEDFELGQASDNFYEVLKGLSSIDQVILTGQDKIQDGDEVYVENK